MSFLLFAPFCDFTNSEATENQELYNYVVYMQLCLKSYIPNAKYCHGCGKSVNLANSDTNTVSEQETSTSRIETDGHNSPVPSTLSWITSTNTQSPSQSFVLARKAIEANVDRNRKKDRKRMKLHDKSGKSTVSTNIGIMTKRENVFVVKRGVALSVTVRKTINY